ncbi:MAG: hypothetical protein EOP04_31205 [Proteobacteria bacterium]|nr:MAG: hypothetical protein EOP04_31205 [Pseudomonadota bacterium]
MKMTGKLLSLVTSFAFLLNSGISLAKAPDFPKNAKVGDQTLLLNGAGTRTATFLAIKVYDMAFYNPVLISKDTEVFSSAFPKKLEIRYRRDFSVEDTRKAWNYQFKDSSGTPEPEYADGLKQLVSYQEAIKKGDVQSFELDDSGSRFYFNQALKGTIPGKPFRDALLKIFFGSNPPTRDLKDDLLKERSAP